jgi:hypothetical protein
MRRLTVGAAAALLAVPFTAVVLATPASAAPACPNDGGAMEQSCMDCITAAGHDQNAQGACSGLPPVAQVSTGFADCDAMGDAYARSNCFDEHLLGRR